MSNPEGTSPLIVQPQLAGGDELKINRKVFFTISCPKCDQDLNVTGLSGGHNVTCPSCGNITILPDFKPRWWFKARNFILTILLSLIIGFLSSYAASYLLRK